MMSLFIILDMSYDVVVCNTIVFSVVCLRYDVIAYNTTIFDAVVCTRYEI